MVARVNVGRFDVGWYLSGMMWVLMMRRHPCGKMWNEDFLFCFCSSEVSHWGDMRLHGRSGTYRE